MAKSIFKVEIDLAAVQKVSVPQGAQILTVRKSGNGLGLWFLGNDGNRRVNKTFYVLGSKDAADKVQANKWIGAVHFAQGNKVLHVFGAG